MAGTVSALSAASLRCELNARAAARAVRLGLPHDRTTGRSPSVIFAEIDPCHHGNFHSASYRAIREQPEWSRRLGKAHSASVRALPRADWRWRELDCAASSDALLMNLFCHPATLEERRVAALLGIRPGAQPRFGVRPRLPLLGGAADTTEVDMQLDDLLVEAKLTESNFQAARPALVNRLRDLDTVFEVDALPRTRSLPVAEEWDEEQLAMVPIHRGYEGHYLSYQLIRGALAAYATGAAFCVLCDSRRIDLIESWHRIQKAVRSAELRCRLQLLTWQELASAVPSELQSFLADKYGIFPA